MHLQNVRDFPQTKFNSERNAPFLLNEHGDPQFFLVFPKNSNNNNNNNNNNNYNIIIITLLRNSKKDLKLQ